MSTLKCAWQENYVDKEQIGRVTSTASYFKGGWYGSHNFKVGVDLSLGQRIQNYSYNQEILEFCNTTSGTTPNTTPAYVRVYNGPVRYNT